jgi:hypothetical protein
MDNVQKHNICVEESVGMNWIASTTTATNTEAIAVAVAAVVVVVLLPRDKISDHNIKHTRLKPQNRPKPFMALLLFPHMEIAVKSTPALRCALIDRNQWAYYSARTGVP